MVKMKGDIKKLSLKKNYLTKFYVCILRILEVRFSIKLGRYNAARTHAELYGNQKHIQQKPVTQTQHPNPCPPFLAKRMQKEQ